MAIQFQYNKTYLQQLNKELRVRENALPTLQAKESALRLEVKKARQEIASVEQELARTLAALEATYRLWGELPQDLVKFSEVKCDMKKIAGVKIPTLNTVEFAVERYSLFGLPSWFPQGIEALQGVASLRIKQEMAKKKLAILEYARKKTTQKVNLYEKVQIPGYREAILKIKRFLEDEENLAKSSQKILKSRLAAAEAAEPAVAEVAQ